MTAAYRVDGHLVSREAFHAAACDPRRSVVVEACAGAGKTWMLVARIVRALLDGAAPQQILAITFTRKAAGEMRSRLTEVLHELAQAPHHADRVAALRLRGLDLDQAEQLAPLAATLLDRVLDGGRAVEVRTFHAWFGQLLRAAPLDLLLPLGLQPQMELIEDETDLGPELFRRLHGVLLGNAALREDHRALIATCGRTMLRRWLQSAWTRRIEIELAGAAGTLQSAVPAAAALWPQFAGLAHPAASLRTAAAVARWRSLARTLGDNPRAKKMSHAAQGIEQALAHEDDAALFDGLWRALFTEDGPARQHLGDSAALHAAQDELRQLREVVDQAAAHDAHRRMARLAQALLAEYAALKRQRGLLDMQDLERLACTVLADGELAGWVQERLDTRLRHLLIDEFQDTSPLQWHALYGWLSAYAGAGGGASGQRPPAVFIVGDPKQSIYRFRRAEPRVFEAARQFVAEALAGQVLECDHTWRNPPAVLEAVNAVFAGARREGLYPGFRPHTTEVRPEAGGGLWALPRVPRPPRQSAGAAAEMPWRPSLTQPLREPDEVLREQEAAQVAAAVHRLCVQQRIAPGEIFVLCRKRASLRLAAAALQALHLPFAAPEETSLAAEPEVRDLIALLDALVSPQHDLSLAQALKSPLFGLADDDLFALSQAAGAGGWWRALIEGAGSAACDRPRVLLQRWAEAARTLPPHDLLDRIVAEGDLLPRLAAAVPAERWHAALQAVNALLAQALQLDGGRYATPYNFVRALRQRALSHLPGAPGDAVQLLTIHGAKGLEARVVFVMDADPEAAAAETATLLVDWPVDSPRPQCVAFLASEARCPPSLRDLLAAERQAREREELNTLYVAMTRARERLVFSATEPMRKGEGRSGWQRVVDHCAAWQPVPASDPGPAPSARHAAVPVLPPFNGTPAPAEPPSVDGDRIADDASRLGQAVHRMLEWAVQPPLPPDHGHGPATSASRAAMAEAAAREFGLHGPLALEVERLAGQVLDSPACGPFFGGPLLRWSANEMPVSHRDPATGAAQVLRIDRLVRLEEEGVATWWVLDYKLRQQPGEVAAYREQLERYRQAVQALQPADRVRAAFITAGGRLVEP